ncbi:MAG TPA: ABC transporter substrate-binding protein [Alphaproteobacteria bacterium]|nr:ABC transporter substrate-binding protein [Alphaproteobacteria bacterium]
MKPAVDAETHSSAKPIASAKQCARSPWVATLLRVCSGFLSLWLMSCTGEREAAPAIPIGLIAPLSGSLAAAGQAIQRGMLLALDEINRDGGILGRQLTLVVRDVDNDPAAGVAALQELVHQHGIAAVFSGTFSPVILAQLDAIHALHLPLINPLGSVTAIVQNGRRPNYAFRVAMSDEYANEFLVRYAIEVVGARHPGIIADTTAWGDSNVAGLTTWLAQLGATAAGVERFDQGDTTMHHALNRLRAAGADALLLVANAPEAAAIIRGMVVLGWKVPVISHSGPSVGRFVELAGIANVEGVLTLQTFSFSGPLSPKAEAVLRAYHARFGTHRVEEVSVPIAVASSYDGVHLLARAIRQAGSTEGPKIREALEHLDPYDGLIKRYAPAFTVQYHDALRAEDYLMAVWREGRLVPAVQPKLPR